MPAYRTLVPLFDELPGERVVVRPYRESDARTLHEAVVESRDHLRPWLPFADAHQSIDESLDFVLRQKALLLLREDMNLAICAREGGQFLGGIGLHPRNWDIGYFEIGYWLRVGEEGHGYMTEAVRLLADFAFTKLHARRIEIRCDARNRHSAGVAERLGFVREGMLRNHMRAADGALRNTLVFALTPDDSRWP